MTTVAACSLLQVGPAWSGLIDAVKAMPPMAVGAPQRSEVVFSTRFTRPEALPVIKAYAATRVEWLYATDAAFAASIRQQVPWLGVALNANGPLPDPAGYARDFDNQVLSAPWMKTWGVHWITTTHPVTREVMRAQLVKALTLGASAIQYDDPQLQLFAGLYQSGDFNEATLRGFRPWLERNIDPAVARTAGLHTMTGSYREWLVKEYGIRDARGYQQRFRKLPSTPLWLAYLRWTVTDYFHWLKAEAASIAGRPVPLSMNLGALFEPVEVNPHFFLASLADYAMSETAITDRSRMVSQWAAARSAGLGSVPSILPRTRAENRIAIAHLYALGAQPIVPWDVYDGNDEQGRPRRFFGAAQDYADLYQFVRQFPGLHDGLEVSPVVGVAVPVDRGQHEQIRAFVRRLDARQIPYRYVFAGGEAGHVPDPARLRHLTALMLVGEPDSLNPASRAALAASGLPGLSMASAVTDEQLDALRPFALAPSQGQVRVVPRVDPDRMDKLVVHLIDEARGDEFKVDVGCRRRIGIKRTSLDDRHVVRAQAVHLGSDTTLRLDVTQAIDSIFITLPGCALWSVLELELM